MTDNVLVGISESKRAINTKVPQQHGRVSMHSGTGMDAVGVGYTF